MKTVYITLFIVAAAIAVAYTQPGRGQGWRLQKMDQLEQLKLIDALNLSEEVSVKFFSRLNEMKKRQRAVMMMLDSLINVLNDAVKANKDAAALKKMTDDLIKTEQSQQKGRADFVASLSDILTPQQVAKFIICEREFRREIQRMMLKKRQGPRWQEDE